MTSLSSLLSLAFSLFHRFPLAFQFVDPKEDFDIRHSAAITLANIIVTLTGKDHLQAEAETSYQTLLDIGDRALEILAPSATAAGGAADEGGVDIPPGEGVGAGDVVVEGGDDDCVHGEGGWESLGASQKRFWLKYGSDLLFNEPVEGQPELRDFRVAEIVRPRAGCMKVYYEVEVKSQQSMQLGWISELEESNPNGTKPSALRTVGTESGSRPGYFAVDGKRKLRFGEGKMNDSGDFVGQAYQVYGRNHRDSVSVVRAGLCAYDEGDHRGSVLADANAPLVDLAAADMPAGCGPASGPVYWEVLLLDNDFGHFGWATGKCTGKQWLGNDNYSIGLSYDGAFQKHRFGESCVEMESTSTPSVAGTVLGFMLDVQKKEMRFFANGQELGEGGGAPAFSQSTTPGLDWAAGFYPAFSFGTAKGNGNYALDFNFGQRDFASLPADFPVNTLTPLLKVYQGGVGDPNFSWQKCTGGEDKEQKSCPGGHGLLPFDVTREGFGCDGCGTRVPVGATLSSCRACDFDLCSKCASTPEYTSAYTCDSSHPLEVLGTSQDNGWSCSGMNFSGGCKKGCTGFRQSTGWDRWRCTQCDFDLCDQCLESKRVPEGSTEGTGEVLGWATIDAHNGEEHCVFLRQAVDGPFGIWGDSGEWKERDVVGIGVDFEQKEISFWHNRKFQGVAFRGEDVPGPFWDADGGGFYPVISLTPTSVDSLASLRVDFNPEEPPDGYRTFADALGEAAKARGGESKGESFEEAKGTDKVAAEIVRTVVNGAAETVASGGSVAVEGKRGESKGEGGGGVEVGGGGGVFDVQCITFDLFATRGDENEFEEATEKTWVNVNRLAVNEGDDEKQTRFMLSMFKSNAEALESLARSEARQVARAICCRGLDAAGGTQGKNEFDLSCRLALHVDDAETVAWAIRAIMEVTDDARYTEVFKRNVMQRLATAEMDGLVRFPDFFGLCNRGNNAFLDMSKSLFAQVSKDAEGKKFWGGHRPVAKVKGSSRTTRAKALEVATATLGSGRIKDGVAAIFESAHNYADNMSEETTISFPGASAIAIVFDAETHTERNYDFLRFRREAGSDEDPWIKEKFTGPQGPENWPSAEPVYIEADSCIAYFHSDSSGNEWGYRFVAVPVYDGAGGNSTVGGREPLIKQGGRAAQEPFEPRKQMSEQISFPGADSITITFDRKNCEMPSPYDFLSLLRSEVSVEDPTSVRERLLTRGDNQASADMMCWGDAPGGMYRGPKEAWPTSVTFNTSEFTLFYSCGDSLHGVSGKTSRDKVLEIAAAALLKGGEEGKDEKVAKVFESKHNYEDNTDEETTISFPGASAIAIVFDAETRTEQNYDFLRFRREAGSDTKPWIRDKFTGAQGLENWPAKEPVYIEADSCVAYFHSDSSGNEWGYRFVAVPVYDGAGSYSITATPHFKDSDADRHLCDMALKVMYLSAGSGSARNSDGSPLGKPKRGSKPLLNRSISMGGVGGGGGGGGSTQDVVYLNEKMLLSDATDSSAPQRIFIPGASELVVTFDGTEGACVCSGGKDQRIEFYSNKNCTTKGRVSYRNKSDQMELAVFTGAESYAGESFRVTGDTVFVKVSYGMEQWGTVV